MIETIQTFELSGDLNSAAKNDLKRYTSVHFLTSVIEKKLSFADADAFKNRIATWFCMPAL